jgi:hypothetical protein
LNIHNFWGQLTLIIAATVTIKMLTSAYAQRWAPMLLRLQGQSKKEHSSAKKVPNASAK